MRHWIRESPKAFLFFPEKLTLVFDYFISVSIWRKRKKMRDFSAKIFEFAFRRRSSSHFFFLKEFFGFLQNFFLFFPSRFFFSSLFPKKKGRKTFRFEKKIHLLLFLFYFFSPRISLKFVSVFSFVYAAFFFEFPPDRRVTNWKLWFCYFLLKQNFLHFQSKKKFLIKKLFKYIKWGGGNSFKRKLF